MQSLAHFLIFLEIKLLLCFLKEQVPCYNGFTLCWQCQVDEIRGEGYAEKSRPFLIDDVIMKSDINIWVIQIRQGLRLLVSILFLITK